MRTVVQHVIATLGGLLQQVMYRELASSLSRPAEHYGEQLPGPDLNPMASSLALWARQTRTLCQIKCQDIYVLHIACQDAAAAQQLYSDKNMSETVSNREQSEINREQL